MGTNQRSPRVGRYFAPPGTLLSNLAASFDAQGRRDHQLLRTRYRRTPGYRTPDMIFWKCPLFNRTKDFKFGGFHSALFHLRMWGVKLFRLRTRTYISLWLHSDIRIAQEINHHVINYSYYLSSCVISSLLLVVSFPCHNESICSLNDFQNSC